MCVRTCQREGMPAGTARLLKTALPRPVCRVCSLMEVQHRFSSSCIRSSRNRYWNMRVYLVMTCRKLCFIKLVKGSTRFAEPSAKRQHLVVPTKAGITHIYIFKGDCNLRPNPNIEVTKAPSALIQPGDGRNRDAFRSYSKRRLGDQECGGQEETLCTSGDNSRCSGQLTW